MKIGILVAMQRELESLERLVAGAALPSGVRIALRQTGIGKVNAALGASALLREEAPDCILSTGCAGSISPLVGVGGTVAGAETAYHDVWCGPPNARGQVAGMPARFAADPRLLAAASAVPGVRAGLIATGDCFVETPEKRADILAILPDAIAVDMESAAIAQVCHGSGTPFLSLRVASDAPGADPTEMQYHSFWAGLADRSFRATRTFLEALPAAFGGVPADRPANHKPENTAPPS